MKSIVKLFVFSAALLSGVFSYHGFTYKTESEILTLTENFQEAYKNQNYDFLDEFLTDDCNITSSEHNAVYGKSSLFDGLKTYETDKVKIASVEVEPIWIQADRAKPTITFDLKGVVLIDEKPSIYYGQYTFTFEKRNANWQIISMNFDVNYRETEPHWLGRKLIGLEKKLKSITGRS